MNDRFHYIDLAKGIGIILVVWGHTQFPAGRYIYSFHMPLFFFISGYLFSIKRNKIFLNKMIRIAAVLLFYYVSSYLFFFIINYLRNSPFLSISFFELFKGVELYRYNPPLWFLTCYLWISIAYHILCKSENMWFTSLFSLFLSSGGFYLAFKSINIPYNIDSALSSIIFFHFGYLVKCYRTIELLAQKLKYFQGYISIILFIGFLIYIYFNPFIELDIRSNSIVMPYFTFFLIIPVAIYSILQISKYIGSCGTIEFFGKYSLIIMSVHGFSKDFSSSYLCNQLIINTF